MVLEKVQQILGSRLNLWLPDHAVQLFRSNINLVLLWLDKLLLDIFEIILVLAFVNFHF